MKKLDLKWKGSKHSDDNAYAKALQSMVDKINEIVEEVEIIKKMVDR